MMVNAHCKLLTNRQESGIWEKEGVKGKGEGCPGGRGQPESLPE
jgi:hypothetical protein